MHEAYALEHLHKSGYFVSALHAARSLDRYQMSMMDDPSIGGFSEDIMICVAGKLRSLLQESDLLGQRRSRCSSCLQRGRRELPLREGGGPSSQSTGQHSHIIVKNHTNVYHCKYRTEACSLWQPLEKMYHPPLSWSCSSALAASSRCISADL